MTDNLRAVVLAGGKGTRLAPFTTDTPKPLVPVGGHPIIELVLKQLSAAGVSHVTLAVNHLSEQIIALVGTGRKYGLTVDYVHEREPLSTVGPLTLIPDLPENFFVMNSDIITDLELGGLYNFHLASPALVTVATHKRSEKLDYGMIECDANNRITGFREKPTLEVHVSMGIYVFRRTALDHVPRGQHYGFDKLMLDLLAAGKKLQSFPHDGYWLDIGRADDYARAQENSKNILSWYT